jgi:dynein heavy chain
MKISIRSVLLNSIKDYSVKSREDWILVHPGQCVLNGSQVHWTLEVEEQIKRGTVKKYFEKLSDQLNVSV